MDLKEFKDLKLVKARIVYKTFAADIKYSSTGSGHYFTLTHITGTIRSFIAFLNHWEQDHTFCVITYDPDVLEMLTKRGYTSDADGHLRIGIKETMRYLDTDMAKKSLPRGGQDKKRIPPTVKAHIQERISRRKMAAE